MPASSASQFKELGLKRKVSFENKLSSKIKKRKWDDEYIKYGFFIPEKWLIEPGSVCAMIVLRF